MRLWLWLAAVPVFAGGFEDLAAQAAAARQANDVPKAMALYKQALELKPDWSEGWWFEGTLAYDSDQYAEGERAFSELVKLDAKNPMAWGFLGLCEFETRGFERSLEHMQRALGQGVEPRIEQVLRFHEVMALDKLGLFDQAMPRLRPFVKSGTRNQMLLAAIGLTALRRPMLPNEVPQGEQGVVAAAGQAAYYWMAGDATNMTEAFKALVDAFGNQPGVHYFYATYLLSFRPVEEAFEEFKKELQVQPHNPDARATIALLAMRAGAKEQAEALAKQAAADGPKSPTAQYAFGMTLTKAGRLEEAIAHLEAAEKLDPSNIEYHVGLAGAYSRAGRHEEARRERKVSLEMAHQQGEGSAQ